MAFFETLKELAGTVVEAVKENPVAAAAIGGGVVVIGGAGYCTKNLLAKRKAAKQAAQATPAATATITPVVAPSDVSEAPKALNEQYQHPTHEGEAPAPVEGDRPQGQAKAGLL